ncbi:MAG: Gfo/Idh/MocA family oxidoreductase [Candidatus Poribacteria bacterium]|nr:Gfo/Idh/MocA family oxidoreductase [Candidatus Poribacteria bacterium]
MDKTGGQTEKMANNDSTHRPLGWALIGCGGAGNGHAQWASSTPEIVVRGFCDIRDDSAQRFHDKYGGAYHTTDADRIFSDPQVDIVSIATSHSSHADLAVAAFSAGKHLFLEKPMAMTTADCLRIYDAMKAAGTKLMIDFSIRFSGAAREIKRRLRPPKVSHGQCMMSPAELSRWRWHPEEGGGPLYDVGVHAVDLLCWIHDADPVEVYATGGQITHPGELGSPDMVDTAAATIRFANGSVATFLMSDAGSNAVVSKWFFEFFDGEQSAVLYEHFSKVTFTGPDSTTGKPESETLKPAPTERLPLLVKAIRNDTEPYVPVRAGILSTLMMEKITASINTGRPQKIEMPL